MKEMPLRWLAQVRREQYDKHYYESPLYRISSNSQKNRNRLRKILAYKQQGRLLEVGYGKDELLKMADRYFDVHGIELSEYEIASMDDSLRGKVMEGDINNVSLHPTFYDAIIMFNLLEHRRNPGDVIDKTYYALTNAGVVIGSVPLNWGLIGKAHTVLSNYIDKTHCSTYTPQQWYHLFRKREFSQIWLIGEVALRMNFSIYIRTSLWKYISINLVFICQK